MVREDMELHQGGLRVKRIIIGLLSTAALIVGIGYTSYARGAEQACTDSNARVAIAAASMAVRFQAIERLTHSHISVADAARIVDRQCSINLDELANAVLNVEPRPNTVAEAILQSTIITLKTCPSWQTGPVS